MTITGMERVAALFEEHLREVEGSARQCTWECEDGWLVVYTTSRIEDGPEKYRGKFAAMAYRPEGKGARTGKARQWRRVYFRAFSTRKAAKAKATALYYQHSPKRAAKHGVKP